MPKVSVILPTYNVAKYIPKWIESLLAQTLKDVEFIFINDASTDNTLDILKQYDDPRIKIISHDINKYTAEARNTGLDNATGEYISFVDPDDYISSNFLEDLYTLAKKENADIAKGIYQSIPSGKITNNNEAINQDKYNFHFSMWTAIYRKSMIDEHNIRFFIDTICGQFPMIHYANKIVTTDSAIYYYVKHQNSCVHCTFSPEKWKKLNIAGARAMIKYINEYNLPKDTYVKLSRFLILKLYQFGYDRMSAEDKILYKSEINEYLDEFYRQNKYINGDKPLLSYFKKVKQKYAR